MTKKYTISVLGGDGTGPEVVEQAIGESLSPLEERGGFEPQNHHS